MDIVYGIQIMDKTGEYIHIAESALEGMSEAAVPGAFLVDQIPWRTYVYMLLVSPLMHLTRF